MVKIPGLERFPKLIYAISTVADGNMSYFFNGLQADIKEVKNNRSKFFNQIGIPIDKTVGIWVEGEDRILVADPLQAGISMTDKEHAVRCDALITNKKDLYLFLLIADCLPVILYDPEKNALAIVHVGWKGAHLEIVKKTIKRMEEEFNINAKDLTVGFGPAARKESFIKENPSQKSDPRWADFVEDMGDSFYRVDVPGFCRHQLIECGVMEENIFDCGIDTVVDKNFYSHYRDDEKSHSDQGRFACAVGLK